MAKASDLSGQRFGHLVAIRRGSDHVSSGGIKSVQWECVCDCGRMALVPTRRLVTGHTKSCGKCHAFDQSVDLTGRRFDKLTVVSRHGYYRYPNGCRDSRWLCRCDCGRMVVRRKNSLLHDGNHDCGHHCIRVTDADMVGRRFGRLVVLRRDDADPSHWVCCCDCGSIVSVKGAQLRNGHSASCGCGRVSAIGFQSQYERALGSHLNELGLKYRAQATFHGLVGDTGVPLAFDFSIEDVVCVECQGEQHYRAVDFFGGEQTLMRQRRYDERKRSFCNEHGIALIEINCVRRPVTDVVAEFDHRFEDVVCELNLQSEGHGIDGFQTMLSIGLGQDQQSSVLV